MRWLIPMLILVSACAPSPEPEPSPEPPVAGAATTTAAASTPATVASTPDTPGTPDTPDTVDGSSSGDTATRPSGFETTRAVVTAADGSTCEICVWLADTATQRSRGLMSVTDLGVGDAMAFRYPEPHTGTFWMKNTILPLSIAFFAPDGTFMTSFDMEPCTTETCPSYATADGFLVALEVPQGGLAQFGVGPGSTLDLLDLPCE